VSGAVCDSRRFGIGLAMDTKRLLIGINGFAMDMNRWSTNISGEREDSDATVSRRKQTKKVRLWIRMLV
jgi:hypothetical protein